MVDLFHSIIEMARQELAGNQFFTGGIILMVFGSALVALRKVPKFTLLFLNRRFGASVEIMGTDTAYQWIQTWLIARKWGERLSHLTVSVSNMGGHVRGRNKKTRKKQRIAYTPAPGRYLLFHQRWPVFIGVIREDMKIGDVLIGFRYRTVIYTFLRGRKFIESIIESAQELHRSLYQNEINIFFPIWESWREIQRTPPRPLESVILNGKIKEEMITDIETFLDRKDWYQQKGIPWKRGYLLSGPPGNGKTSLVKALAGYFKTDIYVLNLSGVTSDQALINLITEVPAKGILLIEDLDSVFKKQQHVHDKPRKKDGENNHITFNGLLNAIDGITSQEGVMLFVTSNNADLIDPALTRPGRIDVKLDIGNPSPDQIEQLAGRIFGNLDNNGHAKKIITELTTTNPSMADVQNRLMEKQWVLAEKGLQ